MIMKRTLLTIALFSLGLSSKGQNLTFVDANNLVITSSNWTNYWKPDNGQVWKIEGINGTSWSYSSYTTIWVNSKEIINTILFPLWVGSQDSIKIKPYGNSANSVDPGKSAIMNYLIFSNE